jgi:hypothetical protein
MGEAELSGQKLGASSDRERCLYLEKLDACQLILILSQPALLNRPCYVFQEETERRT